MSKKTKIIIGCILGAIVLITYLLFSGPHTPPADQGYDEYGQVQQ